MEFHVRRAGIEDLGALAPLFDAYRMFYGQSSDLDGARRFLRARLENGESVMFLAEGKAALGFTQLFPLFSSVRMQRLWLLNDLFVAAQARRGGVATALLRAAHAFAAASGARGVLLETGVENRNAQALYEKLGYRKNTSTWFYELAL